MWCRDIKPAQIFGNLYFVGVHEASSHLIDTGDGLILIDSGYPESLYIVINHIWQLGFNPADIKYIVHTHGHYDHAGATPMLVELTGAKTFVGEADADMVRNMKIRTEKYDPRFEPDVCIKDGDIITLGNTSIRCVTTPGHTDGVISLFFKVTDGEKTYRAGMHGGVGFNTLNDEYLEKTGRSKECRRQFRDGLLKVQDEVVDITLGNHVGQNQTEKKLANKDKSQTNPFIDPTEWKRFIDKYTKMIDELIATEKE